MYVWFNKIITEANSLVFTRGRRGRILDLQLSVQAVSITTKVVSSNPAYGEMYSIQYFVIILLKVMVFNATFNNFLVISWRSRLLVEKTRVHGENQSTRRKPEYPEKTTYHNSLTNLSHNIVSSTSRHKQDSNSQL
jgi:hypothetical protein